MRVLNELPGVPCRWPLISGVPFLTCSCGCAAVGLLLLLLFAVWLDNVSRLSNSMCYASTLAERAATQLRAGSDSPQLAPPARCGGATARQQATLARLTCHELLNALKSTPRDCKFNWRMRF